MLVTHTRDFGVWDCTSIMYDIKLTSTCASEEYQCERLSLSGIHAERATSMTWICVRNYVGILTTRAGLCDACNQNGTGYVLMVPYGTSYGEGAWP